MIKYYAKPGEQPALFCLQSQPSMRIEVFVSQPMTCWLSGEQVPVGAISYAYEENDKVFICSHAAYQKLVDTWMAHRS